METRPHPRGTGSPASCSKQRHATRRMETFQPGNCDQDPICSKQRHATRRMETTDSRALPWEWKFETTSRHKEYGNKRPSSLAELNPSCSKQRHATRRMET